MLIIMHQNMVEQFSVQSNTDKLRMVEAAVGLEPFRENVLNAKAKLTRILSQEESVSKLLEQAEQTLNYWREQYEKYQEKKQLQLKRRFLDRELLWAEVERREAIVKNLQTNYNKTQQNLARIEDERQTLIADLDSQELQKRNHHKKLKTAYSQRMSLEREVAQNQSIQTLIKQLLDEAELIESLKSKDQFKFLRSQNLKTLLSTAQEQIQKATAQIQANQTK